MRYVLCLLLLSAITVKCDSGGYDEAIGALHADLTNGEVPVLGKNQQLLMLKPSSSAAPMTISGDEKISTITIGKDQQPFEFTVDNSSEAKSTTYDFSQTGIQEKPLSIADSIIDINVIVPPKSNRVDTAIRDNIANSLLSVLTGSGALAGSDWKLNVINSSYDGDASEVVTYKYSSDRLKRLKKMLSDAGSEARQGKKFYNPVPLDRMGQVMRTRSRPSAHAKVFLLIADRDLFCTTSSGSCIIIPLRLGINKHNAKEIYEIYGLLRHDKKRCDALGCKQKHGTACYAGSSTSNVNGNAKGCYYDKSEQFTTKKVNDRYPFCGARSVLVNPCYNKPDSYKKYLGGWLRSCGRNDTSCYNEASGYYTPNAGQYHLFNAAAYYDNPATLINNMASSLKAKLAAIKTPGKAFKSYGIIFNITEASVANISVKITKADGSESALQKDSDYTASFADRRLAISLTNSNVVETVFPEGSTMSVTLTRASPVTRFKIKPPSGGVLLEDTVKVMIDNAPAQFTVANDYVTLTSRPSIGAKVSIQASYLQTAYGVTQAEGRTDDDTTCKNKQSTQAVACDHLEDTVTFTDHSQISVGDEIIVTQKLKPGAGKVIDLLPGIVMESVKLTVDSASCDAASLSIVGLSIDIEASYSSCKALEVLKTNGSTPVTVNYDIVSNDTDFDLLVPAELLTSGAWNVRVKIAGQEKAPGVDYVIDKIKKKLTYLTLDELGNDTPAVVEFY